jgi:hypothetical protein
MTTCRQSYGVPVKSGLRGNLKKLHILTLLPQTIEREVAWNAVCHTW